MPQPPVRVQPLAYSERSADAWRSMARGMGVAAMALGVFQLVLLLTAYWPNLTAMRLSNNIAWQFVYTDLAGGIGALALIPAAFGLLTARRWGPLALIAAASWLCFARGAHAVYGAWLNLSFFNIVWHLAAGGMECLLPALLVWFASRQGAHARDGAA